MHQDQNLYCGRSELLSRDLSMNSARRVFMDWWASYVKSGAFDFLRHLFWYMTKKKEEPSSHSIINWSNWPAALVTIERGDKESPEGRNSETVNWLQLPPPSSYCRITMQHSVLLLLLLYTQDTLAQQQYTWMQMLTVNICCSVGAPGFFWRNTFWVARLVTESAVFGIF